MAYLWLYNVYKSISLFTYRYKLRVSKEKYKLQSFTGPILAYFQCYFYLDLLVYCIDYDMIAHTFIIFEIYRKRKQSANQNHCGWLQ